MVNIDIFVDIGEYFFNLFCSFWLDIDGVFCFNNLLFFVRFGKFWFFFFMLYFWGICILLDVFFLYFVDGLNFFVIWENIFYGILLVILLLLLLFSF